MQITYRGVVLELRKLPDGSYEKPNVAQFTTAGRGCTWLDDCRVPTTEDISIHAGNVFAGNSGVSNATSFKTPGQERGRFPANLIVSDDVLNDGVVAKPKAGRAGKKGGSGFGFFDDEKTAETNGVWPSDNGGSYSRYFDLDAWAKTLPFLIVPKAAKSEKNKGCENRNPQLRAGVDKMMGDPQMKTGSGNERSRLHLNNHPTVKPLKLMSYLITLGSRPGDTVLDPFLGSGTTAIAAKQLSRKYIGIEREQEYVTIAEARIGAIVPTLL